MRTPQWWVTCYQKSEGKEKGGIRRREKGGKRGSIVYFPTEEIRTTRHVLYTTTYGASRRTHVRHSEVRVERSGHEEEHVGNGTEAGTQLGETTVHA